MSYKHDNHSDSVQEFFMPASYLDFVARNSDLAWQLFRFYSVTHTLRSMNYSDNCTRKGYLKSIKIIQILHKNGYSRSIRIIQILYKRQIFENLFRIQTEMDVRNINGYSHHAQKLVFLKHEKYSDFPHEVRTSKTVDKSQYLRDSLEMQSGSVWQPPALLYLSREQVQVEYHTETRLFQFALCQCDQVSYPA